MTVISRVQITGSILDLEAKKTWLRSIKVDTVAAAGSSNTNAAALNNGRSIVTGADGTKCAILPKAEIDGLVSILNTVSNQDLPAYPGAGDQINSLTVTTGAFTIPGGGLATFHCDANGHWYTAALPASTALDGVVAGTTSASKALIVDANKSLDVLNLSTLGTTSATMAVNGLAAAQGGAVTVTGGVSSTSANAGGAVALVGGTPGLTGAGGAVNITSGAGGATSGAAGAIGITVGAATSANGSTITLTAGNGAGGTNAGGNVNLIPGTAVSTGNPGEVLFNSVSGMAEEGYSQQPPYATNVPATATSYTFLVANRAYRVKAVSCIASSTATPTVDVIKDTGTTAPGAGTSVLTGAMTFSGSANTRVTGTLSPTIATVTLAVGDRLSTKWGGTVGALTAAQVMVLLEPV